LDDVSLVQQAATPIMPMNRMIGAVGDPQFHGLLGQSYQIHGIEAAFIPSLVSLIYLSLLVLFIYLLVVVLIMLVL